VRATLLASATVDGGGLPTAWELQIQRVRIRRHHRSRVFVTVAHGGLHRRSISATLHGKRASVVTVRLRAHNALGSATGRPRRTRFPR